MSDAAVPIQGVVTAALLDHQRSVSLTTRPRRHHVLSRARHASGCGQRLQFLATQTAVVPMSWAFPAIPSEIAF